MAGLDVGDRVVICTIVRGEILFGIERMPAGRRRAELARIAAADFYAGVKRALELRGRPMDENDLWIAATALALGAALVTRDDDLAGIAGLPRVTLYG